jgi:hypothetical protein
MNNPAIGLINLISVKKMIEDDYPSHFIGIAPDISHRKKEDLNNQRNASKP